MGFEVGDTELLRRVAEALEESNILKEREIKVLESIDKTLIEEKMSLTSSRKRIYL